MSLSSTLSKLLSFVMASISGNANIELCTDDKSSQISWSSVAEERLECAAWDAEYIQHWLRLDETRSALQQQHRDMLELEYDRAELEDWSLSLSNDDLREAWKKHDAATPGQVRYDQIKNYFTSVLKTYINHNLKLPILNSDGVVVSNLGPNKKAVSFINIFFKFKINSINFKQISFACGVFCNSTSSQHWRVTITCIRKLYSVKTILFFFGHLQISISTLPSIQENNTLELEEDSNECLWNDSSYMIDREGREIVTLLMDGLNGDKQWPYALCNNVTQQTSPDNSWSSNGSDYCNSHEPETYSKRSSVAFSGSSDDTGELPAIGTDFTRDFYR